MARSPYTGQGELIRALTEAPEGAGHVSAEQVEALETLLASMKVGAIPTLPPILPGG
jgi:hypothetical protein